ncbi:MAG TPA: site-specific integrase, partial [Acidimicrobiales bacterium]|nr:site-specific integrase [Acidimicrobiales bacterium]
RTRSKYERLLRLHLVPQLGQLHLVDVTTARVRSWRAERLGAGVGGPTVAGAYRLLRAIMRTAVEDELVRLNPCRIKGAYQDGSPERPVATIAEVYAIADAMRPWYRALVMMAAFTSLRWGELIALRRRHLDLDGGFVVVRAAVVEVDGVLEVASEVGGGGARGGNPGGDRARAAGAPAEVGRTGVERSGCSWGRRERRRGARTLTGCGRRQQHREGSIPRSGCGSTICGTRGTIWCRGVRACGTR